VIATVVTLAILFVPIVVWTAVRYWPEHNDQAEARTGPRHRWWQP
jgi:hypothetical protein